MRKAARFDKGNDARLKRLLDELRQRRHRKRTGKITPRTAKGKSHGV